MAEFLEDDDEYFFGQGAVLDGRSLEASRTQGEREYRALERSFKAVPPLPLPPLPLPPLPQILQKNQFLYNLESIGIGIGI